MEESLRVLLTNNTLAGRGGTELYLRDVAVRLLERGHRPVAYSSDLGEVATALREASVPVVDDLEKLTATPDVIHGQHHLETLTAATRFVGVPVVYVCHGWFPWQEAPPRFPTIRRYVAVSEVGRDRLVCESGIPEDRVAVIRNFVDLRRFAPRSRLPDRPRRAVVMHNAPEDRFLAVVAEACARRDIELSVVGATTGNPTAAPGRVLAEHDLVFGVGRVALEGLAVGAAVVLGDHHGLGPMVTAAELDEIWRLNFALRALRLPLDVDCLVQQIDLYDPAEAARVSARVRATADIDQPIDELIALYRAAMLESAADPPDPAALSLALSRYLRWLTPALKAPIEHEIRRGALEAEIGRYRGLLELWEGSATNRLRQRLLALPVIGPAARRLAHALARGGLHERT